MHFNALLSGAVAALLATGVAADCSPTHPIGDKCPSTSEGARFCDPSCSSIIICHDGVVKLNNKCNPGCCKYQNGGIPYCSC
ncbi:hypothetical protein VFPFJ_04607 [Purpureocillium lilacinum]|uniref:Uncharacterized protein n=2 Tax=Purpureocillium lilacinum TaxID=33203 RepID=A0A179H094_PURLI|nr:hypothetical protein VFPFJ_04607 [Purpureocillium lilacinum]KAK4095256.1 hypothetical protein Purlil1_52 [Purpureocillium lilacinum]OAQ83666.1 hypothetical protein VFPBJ_02434 [Purpureocillium lilacinum]OAQ90447.1 hypothetical protein VFPFJ_04607 [Purpureocillium lilacinum]PWI68508.1 hypothetical protein PCL_01597 [Purpureocillium lilacinum]GJN68017.1 hypothetical protein PLICBS_002060 [Purpureocillium lilacinum]